MLNGKVTNCQSQRIGCVWKSNTVTNKTKQTGVKIIILVRRQGVFVSEMSVEVSLTGMLLYICSHVIQSPKGIL